MFKVYAATDIGCRRSVNQDAFFVDGTAVFESDFKEISMEIKSVDFYAAVCDGVGGSEDGALAARLCAEYFIGMNKEHENLLKQLNSMNTYVFDEAGKKKIDTATTVAGIFVSGGKRTAFNVGDSRVFAVNNGYIRQLSVDDTALGLMNITGNSVKQPLLAFIGSGCNVDCHLKDCDSTEKFLICTDGITDLLSADDIERILDEEATLEDQGRAMIITAKERGGHDNITLILLEEQ